MSAVVQPAGTVTLVFTDIEGSTRLLEELGVDAYRDALAEHRAIVREACARFEGYEVDYEGDAFFFAFASARQAVSAVTDAMFGLDAGPIRIRVGVHTGEPALDPPKYIGMEVHRAARIMSCAHGGQVLLSPATVAMLDPGSILLTELGAHRLKDIAEPLSLFQLGQGDFPPLRAVSNTNLPTPASSFHGREQELRDADQLLRQARLLTVNGPGGAGKTRFALELARRAYENRSGDYPDGIFACFFASLRDPALVLPTIAKAVAVREQPGSSAPETLASHFEGKRLLLVCDNLEHLPEAAPELSRLIADCPSLTVLCTSRELLRVQGETPYALPPLAETEAVELVCERARIESSATIRELCARLEGLPLALELAAARLSLLTPDQLLARLSQRLDMLKAGRDADPRQQTLRATIEWSHDLLDDQEQQLFARLSVFVGGCTLEAAEQVCDAELDTLQSLHDKNLLRREDTPVGSRFWVLETIREYASEQLDTTSGADEMRQRHAEFFAALSEELEPPLLGARREDDGPRLLAETDNLRAAIAFSAELDDPLLELRLVGALFRLWEVGGMVGEGRRVAEHALDRADPDEQPGLRAKILYTMTICAYRQGDREASERYCEEHLALAQRNGDMHAVAVVLSDLANNAAEWGNPDDAEALLEESRRVAKEIEEHQTYASSTHNLAGLALLRGDYARARELSEEAIRVASRGEDSWVAAYEVFLGFALVGLEEVDAAAECFRGAIERAHRLLGPVVVAECLDGLAAVAVARDDARAAARLAGAAATMRRDGGILADSLERAQIENTERAGREALGSDDWRSEQEKGASMPFETTLSLVATAFPRS